MERDRDPLYGEVPYEQLRVPLQVKAMVAGRRHLVHQHRVDVDAVTGNAFELCELHFKEHGVEDHPDIAGESMPWSIISLPHRYAADDRHPTPVSDNWETNRSQIDSSTAPTRSSARSAHADSSGTQPTVLELHVGGLPPAKSQRSIFGLASKHHPRLRALLEEAHRVKSAQGFRGFGGSAICLEVELRAPEDKQPGDATNFLGGIADALEDKRNRIRTSGPLDHLGYRKDVGLYDNDRQIKEVIYREVESELTSYTVRLRLRGRTG